MERDKIDFLKRMYIIETSHSLAAREMMRLESDADTKRVLGRIAKIEMRHARLWKRVMGRENIDTSRSRIGLEVSKIIVLRRILGVALTIKTIERGERELYTRAVNVRKRFAFYGWESKIIERIRDDEERYMEPLAMQVVRYNRILSNIKDVILGMNDGLVETLAAVVGFAAALQKPELVLVGGIIVAVSGTLSMSVGAYLSTEYERGMRVRRDGGSKPRSSALYMGIFYILGALVPIFPFAIGLSGYAGVITAVVLTSIVLSVVSVIIALISDISITRRVAKTLLLSISAAAITIALGTYARYALHLVI